MALVAVVSGAVYHGKTQRLFAKYDYAFFVTALTYDYLLLHSFQYHRTSHLNMYEEAHVTWYRILSICYAVAVVMLVHVFVFPDYAGDYLLQVPPRAHATAPPGDRDLHRGQGGGGHQHNPQYANYCAPLPHKRHPLQPAQPQHTNNWAPRTRKRHQREHRPQRPTERSDPTQHAKGRAGDCTGPRNEAATRRHVTGGGGRWNWLVTSLMRHFSATWQ